MNAETQAGDARGIGASGSKRSPFYMQKIRKRGKEDEYIKIINTVAMKWCEESCKSSIIIYR